MEQQATSRIRSMMMQSFSTKNKVVERKEFFGTMLHAEAKISEQAVDNQTYTLSIKTKIRIVKKIEDANSLFDMNADFLVTFELSKVTKSKRECNKLLKGTIVELSRTQALPLVTNEINRMLYLLKIPIQLPLDALREEETSA